MLAQTSKVAAGTARQATSRPVPAAFSSGHQCGGSCSRCRPTVLAPACKQTRQHARLSVMAAAGNGATMTLAPPAPVTQHRSLRDRHLDILRYYPNAMGVDDLMGRVEVALAGFGFSGDNTIACVNLCRDEVTQVLKDKIETIFGSSFNTNGLGGVLTCGVTGLKAGLSHSPVCDGGRERYVFFAFPHIAISADGVMGAITRPGRPNQSCACGAVLKALSDLKSEGVLANCKVPGEHDPLNPEYTILKHRLARRIRYEKLDVQALDLPSLTALAERTISDDLEYLIEKAVDPAVADYAVVTGIQIHNWADELVEGGDASLEFVAPAKCYTVVNGLKTLINLPQVPSLSPRQLQAMAARSLGATPRRVELGARGGVMSEVPLEYLVKKLGGAAVEAGRSVSLSEGLLEAVAPASAAASGLPTWQSRVGASSPMAFVERDANAPTMESPEPAKVAAYN